MASRPHKATDKRRAGLSDNVKVKANTGSTGSGNPLVDLFNPRHKKDSKIGNAKRAK